MSECLVVVVDTRRNEGRRLLVGAERFALIDLAFVNKNKII